jgi:hypothetical protein
MSSEKTKIERKGYKLQDGRCTESLGTNQCMLEQGTAGV